MKTRRILGWLGALAAVLMLGLSWRAWTAHQNLVTLDVRNMDVRDVVRKIEWQVWEIIQVDKAVAGKVTLNVKRMPLEQVLALVASQTSARSSVLYALYSNSRSFTALKQSLRGETDPITSGWTNLGANPWGVGLGGFGPGGPGGPGFAPVAPGLVSLTILNQDVTFAALAFSRFAQTRVVPEDGVTATVNVTIQQAPVDKAVAQLARAVNRDWMKMYALQPGFGLAGGRGPGGLGGPGEAAPFVVRGGREGDPNRPPQFAFGGPPMSEEQRDEARQQREKLEEALKQTLPAEERQKLENAQREREKLMEEMANLTPEQRRDRMGQMGGGPGGPGGPGGMNRMMQERLLNSTPEQRAEMDARMRQFRGPGGSGPGGPPR